MPASKIDRTKTIRALVCAFALGLMWLSIKPAVAWFYIEKAKKAPIESRTYFLTKAMAWDENPKTYALMGWTYLEQAEKNPAARNLLLRMGLRQALIAYEAEPLNRGYRTLLGALLWRLGRIDDAQHILEHAQ